MVATLAGKTVVVVGGTSGIGYAVAKATLLSQAAHVIVVGTTKEKAAHTLERLRNDVGAPIVGTLASDALDAHDLASVRAFCERVGEVDHFIWTAGDGLRTGFPQTLSLDENRGMCSSSLGYLARC